MARRSRTVSVDRLLAELSKLDARRSVIVVDIRNVLSQVGTPLGRGVLTRPRADRWPGFTMSAEAKARISAAQRKRWATFRKAKAPS